MFNRLTHGADASQADRPNRESRDHANLDRQGTKVHPKSPSSSPRRPASPGPRQDRRFN